MKKIALNLLKSADEKLRGISNKQQQQQQQHPPPQHHPLARPHPPPQVVQAPHSPPVPAREPLMAERRVQLRQGRRERRRDGDDGDLKRRSRSEGPSGRRPVQSMDVGSNNGSNGRRAAHPQRGEGSGGNASFERRDPGGLASSPGSDAAHPDPSGTDSDSDSDRMLWTKNPLLVRKVKRSKADKRASTADTPPGPAPGYTQRSTNRESWIYLAPDGSTPGTTGTPGAQEASRESGSGSGSLKSKYQRLEEMRRRRIDVAVTSDEENTPESRISRLRQRALQGALGSQARATASDHNGWGPPGGGSPSPAVMSDQGQPRPSRIQPLPQPAPSPAYRPVMASPAHRQPQQLAKQSNSPSMPVTPQRNVVTSMPVTPQRNVMTSMPVTPQRNVVTSMPVTPQRNVMNSMSVTPQRNSASMPVTPQRNAALMHQPSQPQPPGPRQSLIKPFGDRGSQEVSPHNVMLARQQFYTIPEPHAGIRSAHASSPEIRVRRLDPSVRVPSADSIYDSGGSWQDGARRPAPVTSSVVPPPQRAVLQPAPPPRDGVHVQRGAALPYQSPVLQRQQGGPQFNEVVELRLKSSRVIDRPLSQTFPDAKGPRRQADGGFNSEDSLDELIESNIQYLEKEIKQGGPRQPVKATPRSSGQRDPPKAVSTPVRPRVTVSGQQSARPAPHSNKSELHFRVQPQPQAQPSQPAPQIRVADDSQWSDSSYPGPPHTFGVSPRGERKHSYDSRTRTSRPTSEYYDRDDLSKSDTQLNSPLAPPAVRGALLHPHYMAARGCVSDQNLTVDQTQGMFSDVEYDIEVSERVKKWETFMKKPDFGVGADGKKAVGLTPIEERTEGDRDSLMMPSEVRRSVRMSQAQLQDVPSLGQQAAVSLKPASSDPTLHVAGDARLVSKEMNLHRFFQVVADPRSGAALSQSTSSVYIDLPRQGGQLLQTSASLYRPPGFMSPDELRQHMLTNQRQRAQLEGGDTQLQLYGPPNPPGPDAPHPPDSKRLSRYQDEIEEMRAVKHQSVSNLRRRFDDGRSATDDDDAHSDLRAVARVSPTPKEEGDVNWSQMITGLEDKIRDMEVWSPGMESTQGSVVSIERVKARTLQTIPFSEDPFWKEIEEMTTFDPDSLGGHLAVSEATLRPAAAPGVESAPHSSTLPTQPRPHPAMSMRERLQRSKSLYTPNIPPLTVAVDPYGGGKSSSLERGSSADKYSGPSALDDVLEDIRSSLERKPLSPKRRPGDSSDSHRSSPGPSWTADLIKARADRARGVGPHAEPSLPKPVVSSYASHVAQPAPTVTAVPKAAPGGPGVSGVAAPGGVGGMTVGHYHLDPHLLKQKLLSTGLVEDERPEPPTRRHTSGLVMSKPVAVAPPQTVVRPVIAAKQPARPANQQQKLNQVNDSMEELRQLAVTVEQKIGLIKSRLLTADDHNLDKILLALRKYAPSTEPRPDVRADDVQDLYHNKKHKLEDALTELERIYASLDLNNDTLVERAERRDYGSYGRKAKAGGQGFETSVTANTGSLSDSGRGKASSVFISPLPPVATMQAETVPQPRGPKADMDRQTQSEFDVISKSFQAIIDEVNKTASLVSSASTPQSRPQPPLPEIKELQSKLYASKEHDFTKYTSSPEIQRRSLLVTSQGTRSPVGPTPKSPPAVAPKPFRGQPSAFPLDTDVTTVVSSSGPVTSVVRAEVARPAPEKREPRVRARFRPKPSSQERDEASKRARSKSSPTITLQDLRSGNEASAASSEKQPTAKSQLNFKIEPVVVTTVSSKKPPLQLDIAKAQQGAVAELQLKPPAMFQDQTVKAGQAAGVEVSQLVVAPVVVKPAPDSAPPLDTKTVICPASPHLTATATATATTQAAAPSKHDASSSESSAEGRDKKGGKQQRLGRGVAMMVELFSSSDEERLRRSHPLHTRSAPDLSADVQSDDAASVSKDSSCVRPAELAKVMQQRAEQASPSPLAERRGVSVHSPVTAVHNDSLPSPQSPSNKPPFHPFKRQQRSPDWAGEGSQQKITILTSEPKTAAAAAGAETSSDPSTAAKPTTVSASKVMLRVRPARVPAVNDDDDLPERPRSFHELLSSFEPDPHRLGKLRTLRKCASEELFAEQLLTRRAMRASSLTSEPDLRGSQDAAPTLQEVRQWTLQ